MPLASEDLLTMGKALGSVVSPLDTVEEVLCSQAKAAGYLFAVVRVKSGAICAVWESHAAAFSSAAEMLSAEKDRGLNAHEKSLYALQAHAG